MTTKHFFTLVAIVGAMMFLLSSGWALNWAITGLPAVQASELQQAEDAPRTITVIGEGEVSAPPDLALVQLGVQVSHPDVKEATQQAATQMESLLAALKAAGVADKDLQTSYYSLYVNQPYGISGPEGEPQYQVSNTMQVTVRDLANLTTLLGAAIESGANAINSVDFKLADPSKPRSEARAEAVTNAQSRAKELADLNGVAVGEVMTISEVVESGDYFIGEQNYAAAQGLGGGGGGPISPGNVTVNVQLQVTYSMLR